VTSVVDTLVDLATCISEDALARAVDEADRHDLIAPDSLRAALDELAPRPGLGRLRRLLDRATFRLTDSELERTFLAIAREAGLPPPETRVRLNGYRVDFLWPELRLVVETDGLRYHRTPFEQARDREPDQAHAAAGFTPLRFTHAQVRYERPRVRHLLAVTAARLGHEHDG
jgi:very-short-patch-repair endonuclease